MRSCFGGKIGHATRRRPRATARRAGAPTLRARTVAAAAVSRSRDRRRCTLKVTGGEPIERRRKRPMDEAAVLSVWGAGRCWASQPLMPVVGLVEAAVVVSPGVGAVLRERWRCARRTHSSSNADRSEGSSDRGTASRSRTCPCARRGGRGRPRRVECAGRWPRCSAPSSRCRRSSRGAGCRTTRYSRGTRTRAVDPRIGQAPGCGRR